MYDADFYDTLIREQDLDLICQQLAHACERAASSKRRENDEALGQAWEQDAAQFQQLSDTFSAGDFYLTRPA